MRAALRQREHGEQARVVEKQLTRSYRIVAQQHVGQRRHGAEVVHDEDPVLLVDCDEVGDAGGELVVAGEELERAALAREPDRVRRAGSRIEVTSAGLLDDDGAVACRTAHDDPAVTPIEARGLP